MSIDEVIREVATWPDDQVRRLRAFLVTLLHQRKQEVVKKLAGKIDAPKLSRWVSLEDAEERLGLRRK